MDVNTDSLNFWSTLEADFATKFPNYFKNILTMTGFGTAASFVLLNRVDIQTTMDFVRHKLVKRVDWSSTEHIETMVNFYGKYYLSAPQEFEFQAGELKLIDKLVEHVKKKLSLRDGYKYFQQNKNVQEFHALIETPFGRFFGELTQPTVSPGTVLLAKHGNTLNTEPEPSQKGQKNDLANGMSEDAVAFLCLLLIAEKTDTARSTAQSLFARKHGDKYVVVRVSEYHNESEFVINKNQISAHNIQGRVRILRCFGPVITKLEMFFWPDDDQAALSDLYNRMSQYCATCVTEVLIHGHFTKQLIFGEESSVSRPPFVKVERVTFKSAEFHGCFPNLAKYFPNARELNFNECTAYSLHKAPHLPQLQRLTLYNFDRSFPNESLTTFIRWNPQLKSLRIYFGVGWKLLTAISEHLDQLECLDITVQYDWEKENPQEIIKFKNVRSLIFGYFCIKMPDISSISFDLLEEFEVVPDFFNVETVETNPHILNFVARHPLVKKFKCRQLSRGEICSNRKNEAINSKFALRFAKALPSVTECDLRAIFFRVDEAIDFVENCSKLKVFYFRLDDDRHDLLRERLSKDWTSTFEETGVLKLYR